MKITKTLTLLLLFVFAAHTSFSQEGTKKVSPVRLLIKGALELGGDDVAQIYFTNGDKQSVKAGQGGTLAVGGEFQIPSVEKLLFHATVGYKYVTTKAENAHIRLTRVPIQFTANWMVTKKLRLGAGMVTHQGIRFKADGIGQDTHFDGATGPTFEIAYSGIGLSYTAMTYKDPNQHSYSANAIGLTFSLTVPKR
ncbi:MAG: hypothetical protein M3Q06_14610 [Bacteroidota bacterium]|nr:hypothetical protein [Bacteroidota bacterium]